MTGTVAQLLLLLFSLLLLDISQAQESTDPTGTYTTVNTTLNRDFKLLWYHWLAIIVVFAVVVIVLAPATVCLVHHFRKAHAARIVERPVHVERHRNIVPNNGVDAVDMDALFKNMDCCYNEIARTDINILGCLGIGEFGPLYDAEVKISKNDVQRAMIKVFQQGTSQDLVRFREEVERLRTMTHPRVAGLFGVVSKAPYYIVTELSINGDLKSFLHTSSDKEDFDGKPAIDVPKLVAMAADVASGLSYLECLEYVHKDIAARNCLVTEDLCIKITDFKVGRFLCRSEYAVQADGSLMPLRWMAPETIEDNRFTLESSVWSFGVLLWEIMSRGAFPYASLSDEEVANAVFHHNNKLPQPKDCPDRVFKVMYECWSRDQYTRPHMALVHKLLESSILTNKYDKSHPRLYS